MRATELFKVGEAHATSSRTATFHTPLGAIDLSFSADGGRFDEVTPVVYKVAPDAYVLAWEASALRVELLLAPLPPDLPKGMSVDGGQAAVWRARATQPVRACTFEARWRDGLAPADGGLDAGQGLVALSWEQGGLQLSLGAPNAHALAFAEGAGTAMPEAWHALIAVDDPSIVEIEEYLTDGLRLRLPGIRAGEVAQMHMAVAWADRAQRTTAPWHLVNVGWGSLARIVASVA